MENVKMIKLKW